MFVGLAGSLVLMSCLGCSGLSAAGDVVRISAGPVVDGVETVTYGAEGLRPADNLDPIFKGSYGAAGAAFRLPLNVGDDFSPKNWALPDDAGRFKQLDLSTPLPLRAELGDRFSAEMAFGAPGDRTGLGVDVELAPRAQIQRNLAGGNVANFGGELRIGRGLADRDLRHTRSRAPAWYFFVGADNQALVWNLADHESLRGMALRDQVTVGDLQAGVAFSSPLGGQMSFGLIERHLAFTGITSGHDMSSREEFAAFSFTLKR